MLKSLRWFFGLFLVSIILGCTTNNTTNNPVSVVEETHKGMVMSSAYSYYCEWCQMYHNLAYVVYSDNEGFGKIPVARIAKDTLPVWRFNDVNTIEFVDYSFDPPYGDNCSLNIYSERGHGYADLVFPDTFRVTSPADSAVVPFNIDHDSILSFKWNKSTGAERYEIMLSIYFYYADTFGYNSYAYNGFYKTVDDTSITISLGEMFPGDFLGTVDSIIGGSAGFSISAYSGPSLEPGTPGNVLGDDKGFYALMLESRYSLIYLNNTYYKSKRTDLSMKATTNSWWDRAKEFGYYKGDYSEILKNSCPHYKK